MARETPPAAARARRPAAALLLAAPLAGCALEPALGPGAVVGGASLVFTGKTPLDHVVGAVTGRDCSAVRWERRGPWCVTPAPPEPVPYCTRSLGRVDCWTAPPVGAPVLGVADPGPRLRSSPEAPGREVVFGY